MYLFNTDTLEEQMLSVYQTNGANIVNLSASIVEVVENAPVTLKLGVKTDKSTDVTFDCHAVSMFIERVM
jgi:hypothetical protein